MSMRRGPNQNIEIGGGNLSGAEMFDNTHKEVETYVEVRVQYYEGYSIVKQTDTCEGRMPYWNEQLQFPLKALKTSKENFTLEELKNSTCIIYISLFDKEQAVVTQGNQNVI